MWNLSPNNEWITSFNSCQIIIGNRVPQQQPLLTIQRFSTLSSYIIIDEEEYKSLEQMPGIFQYFQQKKLNRNSCIDICGGGLTLDIGGYAASVYMRGMKCNYFPTTLLSMVDASVGGKTGINFEGKNTIGSIKQPQGVYINVNTLKSLDKRELMNGMAEVIKMAFVYDKQFFKWLQLLDKNKLLQYDNITHIIKQSIRLKIQVVQKDVNEKHQRKWLNFGHTIGHAIEYMRQPELKHGQCVSIGMVLANKLATEQGILQNNHSSMQLKELLQKFQLPTKLPHNFNASRCIDLMLKDKKQSSSQNINFVFVKDIGQPCPQTTQISPQLIRKLILNEPLQISSKIQSNPLPLNQKMFPSSKSLSIRYLYASALKVLSDSKSFIINNCLHSDDTIAMISCLKKLGFQIIINKDQIIIQRFNLQQKAILNVGNSGLTARFILPLCTILGGEYQIQCDKRMQQRPNQELFRLLESFGANVKYLKQNNSFPVKIIPSQINIPKKVSINGIQSSQFISSILFLSLIKKMPLIQAINPNNNQLVSQSFIRMTISVLKSFGIVIKYESNTFVHQLQQDSSAKYLNQFTIEPDYAGLSYPYLHRLLNSHSLPSVNYQQSLQGDSQFYKYIQQLQLTNSNYVELNFNNCTDTFMTMLIYVICKKNKQFKLKITHIHNQRDKQSNRISAMIQNLSKVADIEQNQDGVTIRGGIDQYKMKQYQQIIFQSYDDHRIGMSLAVLSSHLSKLFPNTKFMITKPDCVNKTFPNFWKWMESQNSTFHPYCSKQLSILKQKQPQSYYLIGMRGCGKTTYAQSLSSDLNLKLIQMDKICTQNINSQFKCSSISELVQKHGWNKFRQVQTQTLKKIVKEKNVIVATGGGIVQTQLNRHILRRQQCIYIEKRFEDLLIQESSTRPSLNQDLRLVFNRRQKLYQQLAKTIITLNQSDVQTNTSLFIKQFKRKYYNSDRLNGFVLCSGNFDQAIPRQQYDWIEWRVDQLLKQHSLKDIRFKIAQYYYQNQLPTILTLRTKQQFGSCDKNQYHKINNQIKKIPTQYIDLEIVHNAQNESVINPLWSYHGSQRRWIQEMKLRKGMKKVILTPQRYYKHYQQKYFNDFDLFWTMGLQHRTTRLNSNIKMVTSKEIQNNLYGIMTKKQFTQLFNLVKKVIK